MNEKREKKLVNTKTLESNKIKLILLYNSFTIVKQMKKIFTIRNLNRHKQTNNWMVMVMIKDLCVEPEKKHHSIQIQFDASIRNLIFFSMIKKIEFAITIILWLIHQIQIDNCCIFFWLLMFCGLSVCVCVCSEF
mgnify:CR=1 FL=1